MRDLLDRGIRFDAVFGLNDTLALGAMRVLQEAGLRVPEDVAVVGWDDLDEAQYSILSLTTIDPGEPWIAETAVRTLIQRIKKTPDAPEVGLQLSDFLIVERESTSTYPSNLEASAVVPLMFVRPIWSGCLTLHRRGRALQAGLPVPVFRSTP